MSCQAHRQLLQYHQVHCVAQVPRQVPRQVARLVVLLVPRQVAVQVARLVLRLLVIAIFGSTQQDTVAIH
jgi:hypothetical protein